MGITLKGDERDPFPVVRHFLVLPVRIMLFHQIMGAAWMQAIRDQAAAIQLVTVHPILGIQFKELICLFGLPLISIHLIQPAEAVQFRVFLICPERDNLIVIKPLKHQLSLFIVIWIQITDAAINGIPCYTFKGT